MKLHVFNCTLRKFNSLQNKMPRVTNETHTAKVRSQTAAECNVQGIGSLVKKVLWMETDSTSKTGRDMHTRTSAPAENPFVWRFSLRHSNYVQSNKQTKLRLASLQLSVSDKNVTSYNHINKRFCIRAVVNTGGVFQTNCGVVAGSGC